MNSNQELQLKVFKGIFKIIEGINIEENSHSIISIVLAKIYPLIFTEFLLSNAAADSCPIETFTLNFIKSIKKPSNLECLRLIQVVILTKSVRISEEDEGIEESFDLESSDWIGNRLGITLISNVQDPAKRNQNLAEGIELFNQFLRIHKELKPSMLTGWINLLHPIVKSRPSFYPSLIPTLLSFTEIKWSESFTPTQRRNILHTLKAELTLLASIPQAEKFKSLISNSLDKCVAMQNASGPGGNKAKGDSEANSVDGNDAEEEEKELSESLGGIQERIGQRPSGAFAETSEFKPSSSLRQNSNAVEYESLTSEALSRELAKIPGPMVTEMVVRMLGSWTIEQIRPVITSKWKRIRDETTISNVTPVGPEIVLKKSTEEAFTLEAGPMTPELPGEIIHLSLSRILQSITDLSEFHISSRRDDLIASLEDPDGMDIIEEGSISTVPSNSSSGIPIPLIPHCRIIALIAAHVGHVRSDILMDPEDRRKKLDRQFDPRFQKEKEKIKDKGKEKDIFGSSSEEDDDVKMEDSEEAEEFDKTVNQIVLGWINEDLPGRFDFVWFWLEAVWIREGKSGNLDNSATASDECADYDKLFDDVIGIVGEYFIPDYDEENEKLGAENIIHPGILERVLKILLKVPKLNASFIRNLLYPLIEESRYRPVAFNCLARLLIQRPALRAVLTDFVMTLAESEDANLRKDTIEILLLKAGVYPNLRSISSQLEAYSLDLMDDLATKEIIAISGVGEGAMKKLKLESSDNLQAAATVANAEDEGTGSIDLSYFEANTELFLGLLKRNPERLLPPLLVRFPRFSVKLQAFLLDRSLPNVIQSWKLRELTGLRNVLKNGSKADEGGIVGELVLQIVKLVLTSSNSIETTAESVDFYEEFSELVQTKVTGGTWDGRLIPDLIPWILRDRSDLPDFYNIYLPKMISTSPGEFLASATRICSSGNGQLINPVQLFVQIHLISISSSVPVPLKNLIEVLQVIFGQSNTKDALFTVHVISSGLGQLVDQNPLPPLLGRSLLQSIPLLNSSSPLNAPFLLSLLARLIPRKIWEAGKLWEGWIRCSRALLPGSLSVLLQLPTAQLDKLLKEAGSDLKAPLKEYLYNQPPSVRNRYASILATIEKSTK